VSKTDERSELGLSLEEGLKEALAWKRGEIALETVNLDPMRGRDVEGPYQAGSLLEHDIGVAFRSARGTP
jgi:hypothetical protein